jgi:hypothetical protein
VARLRRGTNLGRAARDCGILAVTDGRNYITGLCSYRVVPHLAHGRLLDADHFLAFDLSTWVRKLPHQPRRKSTSN